MPFLSDNNLVVDAAVRRVIQVPRPAEGTGGDVESGGDVYRGGDVDRDGDVESSEKSQSQESQSQQSQDHWTSHADRISAQAKRISRLKAVGHADSSNPTVSSPPSSGKNKQRSRDPGRPWRR
jgi:hypothetical protein